MSARMDGRPADEGAGPVRPAAGPPVAGRPAAFPAALAGPPAERWAEAVSQRHSVRTYRDDPVPPAALDALETFCVALPGQEAARVALVRDAPAEVFTGIVGRYGRVLGASSALLVIGDETAASAQEAAGYLGEAAILEATALGLGTCWIGGFFDRRLASTLVTLAPGERILAVSPLGNAPEQPRTGEKWMKRLARSHTRRSVGEIAPGLDRDGWPNWAAEGIRLARLAPSAVNRQPWRFGFAAGPGDVSPDAGGDPPPGVVTVTATEGREGGISRRLDCGIAMLHFEVGARIAGADGTWQSLEAPGVARYVVAVSSR